MSPLRLKAVLYMSGGLGFCGIPPQYMNTSLGFVSFSIPHTAKVLHIPGATPQSVIKVTPFLLANLSVLMSSLKH